MTDNASKPKWTMGRIPQHVVMEFWTLGDTDTTIVWGMDLYEMKGEAPFWVEFYPHYKDGDPYQEKKMKYFYFASDAMDYIRELTELNDEEYLNFVAASRNEFVDRIAEMIMEI